MVQLLLGVMFILFFFPKLKTPARLTSVLEARLLTSFTYNVGDIGFTDVELTSLSFDVCNDLAVLVHGQYRLACPKPDQTSIKTDITKLSKLLNHSTFVNSSSVEFATCLRVRIAFSSEYYLPNLNGEIDILYSNKTRTLNSGFSEFLYNCDFPTITNFVV